MSVTDRVIICVHLLILQQSVLPVTAQITLDIDGTVVEGSDATFDCMFTGTFNAASLRKWVGPGSVTLINNGASSNAARYTETIDSANNMFSMTIQNYGSSDEGIYRCQYKFDTSTAVTLSISNTEVHPSSPRLDSVTIPKTAEAISLTISVPIVRPNASASFNLTSSGTLNSLGSGNAVVTATDDGNGRTSSYSLKIDVPAGTTSTGDIFTIELVVGAYTETKQWTITGTPTPSTTTHGPPVCSCSWLPCGWKCYYLYIIIVALVVIIVSVIVGVCCCYRRGYFGKNKEEDKSKSYSNQGFDENETENGQPTGSPKHTAL